MGWAPPALALNPRLDVSQVLHTSWKSSDGFGSGTIVAIAQTADGYLWVGTSDGLFRFDGVKASPWLAPGQELPSERIVHLLATPDGSLWIATDRGLASWRDGTLTKHQGPEEQYSAGRMVQDRDGVVWGIAYLPRLNRRVLCSFNTSHAIVTVTTAVPALESIGLHVGSKGELWAGVDDGVWRWKPAPARFYPLEPQMDGFQGMVEDANGTLLLSRRGYVQRFADGAIRDAVSISAACRTAVLENARGS